MMTSSEVSQVFDTILSIPGMNEVVKIDLKISRKNVLLLNHVIERGLAAKDGDKEGNLLGIVPKENLSDLKTIAEDCLQKAGLVELKEKLNVLTLSK
ncbi:hypothetical protein [Flavobacterium lindanitolerans]|uniref:hypothetical protein n=1 Tax=Flavobacterium lindanitolerans TaxID=428988 RepID=UPI0023F1520F|nr:hypothetical protein [Flavobacterium lindanitolerans]